MTDESQFRLAGLAGLCLFFLVRTICMALLLRLPSGPQDTRLETTSLLSQSPGAGTRRLSRLARLLCALDALVYMCITVLAAFQTFLEHGQSVIHDGRFAIFRGGEVSYALIVLLRVGIDARYDEGQEMRIDSISLVLLPWIMLLIQTPTSSRLEFVALDWVITPALGIAIFSFSMCRN
ncbi:hypothetical protein C8J56DRAFT_931197 [Mycena floridula]|nr:hypothetical protein C8J56DRAFT_931197 [Mycena floridula]